MKLYERIENNNFDEIDRNRAIKTLLHNRNEIDYKKYTKKDNKGIWYTFCFIPILRVIVLLVMYWLTVASKEDLDKLFDRKED